MNEILSNPKESLGVPFKNHEMKELGKPLPNQIEHGLI